MSATKEKAVPLPFSQREWIRLAEVPAYLMHYYNLRVSIATVYRWRDEGMVMKDQEDIPLEAKKRATLLCEKRASRWFVRTQNLEAFLNAT